MQKLGREIKEFLKEFDWSDLSWSVAKERAFEIDFSDLEEDEIYDISGEEWGFFFPDTDKNKKISFQSLFKGWENISALSSVEEAYNFCQNTERHEFYIFAFNEEDAKQKAKLKLSSL